MEHIEGNCLDYVTDNRILVNKYGVYPFHANSEVVGGYVRRFSEWGHRVVGKIGQTMIRPNKPANQVTIPN